MALYKNNDWNSIGVIKVKNYAKKINTTQGNSGDSSFSRN